MIELIGEEGTSEFAAAVSIRDSLLKLWPGLDSSPPDEELVKIAADAKISGYQVSDIDIAICARFRPGRRFLPKRTIADRDGNKVTGQPIGVPNLVLVVEVKDHDPAGVRIQGDAIFVKYASSGPVKWSSATDQNITQAHSLKQYFQDQHTDVFVHRLVILRGLDRVDVNGALPNSFSGADLLTQIAAVSSVSRRDREYVLSSSSQSHIDRALSAPLFRRILPSLLDRRRMDRIATRKGLSEAWFGVLGKSFVRLRGRGGSGKTVLLLQTAWRAYDETGARSLFLTYNLALLGDVKRSMALLGIPGEAGRGGITVASVTAFMRAWFFRLGITSTDDAFLTNYDEYCATAATMLREAAITPSDIEAVKRADPERFDFDFLMIDEAQDWPEHEVNILKLLYGPKQICIADGIDQMVRSGRPEWEAGIVPEQRVTVPLKRCLRMKANLAVFANAVAESAGLAARLVPNDEAGGGRVIVLDRPYAQYPDLHAELLTAAKNAGNAEIDFLFCVPPIGVKTGAGGRSSELGNIFLAQGLNVWDATNEDVRRDFPRATDTYRIVQYSSCRGLEGWTVVAEGMDEFWRYRRDTAVQERQMSVDEAALDAWQWCMIALTRPIDTLVITTARNDSVLTRMVREIAANHPDFVERY